MLGLQNARYNPGTRQRHVPLPLFSAKKATEAQQGGEMEVDLASIGAMLTSLKSVSDIVKDWWKGGKSVQVSMDTIRDLNSAVLDAQDHAMTARQNQYELIQRNETLEKEIKTLRDWSEERENYELVSASTYGALVYAPKASSNVPGAEHWLCQHCFENAKKSMLQFVTHLIDPHDGAFMAAWKCSVCPGEIRVQPHTTPSEQR